MKRLSLLLLPAVLVVGLAAGCSKSSDTTAANDQAKQADQLLGGGNCVQLATTWAQLFVPLSSGGTDADKEKIKTQIADIKSKVPANVGKSLDTINQGIENAKTTADVQKFVTSAEFTKANQDVNTYLTTECSKLGK